MCKPIGYLFSFVLSHMIFIMAVVFVSCTKNNTETDEPQKTVEGKYIGIRNYIYEGKIQSMVPSITILLTLIQLMCC